MKHLVRLCLCIALTILAGAGRAMDDPTRPPPDELRIALHNGAVTLNPALTAATATIIPGAQLFASLFRLDGSGAPQPYLARQWHLSDDGLRLEVALVDNARFHDGQPITARDVAFSIRAVRDHHSYRTMLAAVARVETPDPHRVVVHLHHPHPALFTALAVPLTPILPAHVFDDGRPLRTHPGNRAPIGSGPFRLAHWDPPGELVLTRVEDFFLGPARLERLVFSYYTDIRQLILALAAGEHQFAPFLAVYAVQDFGHRLPAWLVSSGEGYQGLATYDLNLVFNLERPPWQDRRVRQAIAHALDREYLFERVFDADHLAIGPFPPDHLFAYPVMTRYPLDEARADALLNEAGLRRDRQGQRFEFELLLIQGPRFEAFADYLRWTLGSRFGIGVRPVYAPDIASWQRRLMAGDFQVSIDVRLPWRDPLINLHHIYHSQGIRPGTPFGNYARYADPGVDALLDEAARTLDPARRSALYRRFARRVAEDLPYLWLVNTPTRTLRHRDLDFPTDSPWAAAQPYHRVGWRARH